MGKNTKHKKYSMLRKPFVLKRVGYHWPSVNLTTQTGYKWYTRIYVFCPFQLSVCFCTLKNEVVTQLSEYLHNGFVFWNLFFVPVCTTYPKYLISAAWNGTIRRQWLSDKWICPVSNWTIKGCKELSQNTKFYQ